MKETISQNYSTNDRIEDFLKNLGFSKNDERNNSVESNNSLDLIELWNLMDKVWDEMDCNSNNLDADKITAYYQHPVWLLNGLFIEQDNISLQHRDSISDWIIQKKLQKVLDFGGGSGTLGRMIADKTDTINVDIFEPHPNDVFLSMTSDYPKLSFVKELNREYDCIVCIDVLEHVPDPLATFARMIELVKMNGYLLIANHFYPCIKCHLPQTFHFRYSFDRFAEAMGLEKVGRCEGSHAIVYQKISDLAFDWEQIRRQERISRLLFVFREFDRRYLLSWRRRFQLLLCDPVQMLQKIRQKANR